MPCSRPDFNLAKVGYQESEYFVSGTATSYTSGGAVDEDGKWTVTPDATAPYTTASRRPPSDRSGEVQRHRHRRVAQRDAARSTPGPTGRSPTTSSSATASRGSACRRSRPGSNAAQGKVPVDPGDPVRYAALSHPGDSYSYDIFSQAGQAIRDNSALMLGGLTPTKLIAAGESQSAGRMVTYIDAVQPLVHVYDGFLVHSRVRHRRRALAGTAGRRSRAGHGDDPQRSRTFPCSSSRPKPTCSTATSPTVSPTPRKFRLWEVAGTSHYDYYGLVIGPDGHR